jgi:hypothetical protein
MHVKRKRCVHAVHHRSSSSRSVQEQAQITILPYELMFLAP